MKCKKKKKKNENKKRVIWRFFNFLYSLSQVFNNINDNLKIKRLCAITLQTNKVKKV